MTKPNFVPLPVLPNIYFKSRTCDMQLQTRTHIPKLLSQFLSKIDGYILIFVSICKRTFYELINTTLEVYNARAREREREREREVPSLMFSEVFCV